MKLHILRTAADEAFCELQTPHAALRLAGKMSQWPHVGRKFIFNLRVLLPHPQTVLVAIIQCHIPLAVTWNSEVIKNSSLFGEIARLPLITSVCTRVTLRNRTRHKDGMKHLQNKTSIKDETYSSLLLKAFLAALTGSWPATPWAAGRIGLAAACRWAPAASRSWAASAPSAPSSCCPRSSTPCYGASPCTGWRCSWLSMSVHTRDQDLDLVLCIFKHDTAPLVTKHKTHRE